MPTSSPCPGRAGRAPVRLFTAGALGATLGGCRLVELAAEPAAPIEVTESGDGEPETNPEPPPLMGFWGLNGYVSPEGFADVQQRFGINGFQVANEDPLWTVRFLLPMVREAGMRVTLRLAGPHPAYTVDGDFSVERWKEQLARWRRSGVQEFIDDGTLAGHMMLDDITLFEGHDPDAADLEEMARYSKALLPGLMTYVRQKATQMPEPDGGCYLYVDACVNQYEAAEGSVARYAREQAERAAQLDLGVINGLNIADGGDGSAGRPGYRPDHYPMTAAEITAYGSTLARVPACGMFLNWEYDGEEAWSDGSIGATYFDQPDLQAALAALAALYATHPPVTLLKPAEAR
ncbi:MAG: hypothetical protein ABIO70_01520 [Pseudomonadota bacterium]